MGLPDTGDVEDQTDLGGHRVPHEPHPGSLRYGVHCSCTRTGMGIRRIGPGPGDNLHRWASGKSQRISGLRHGHGLGGASPRQSTVW